MTCLEKVEVKLSCPSIPYRMQLYFPKISASLIIHFLFISTRKMNFIQVCSNKQTLRIASTSLHVIYDYLLLSVYETYVALDKAFEEYFDRCFYNMLRMRRASHQPYCCGHFLNFASTPNSAAA